MKNLSLVLNIVLLIAVAVLFYLHFSTRKSVSYSSSPDDTVSIGDLKIAYINSDSVFKYYDYLKVNILQLEAKTKKLDQDYRSRAMALQAEYNNYQRSVNSMTLGQVRATEEDLTKKQQNLQLYQQTLSQQVMEDESKLKQALYDRMTTFLKKYGQDKGLQIVLRYDQTSDVLYGRPGLDISRDVIKGLNESFKEEKAKNKADSLSKK